MSSKEYRFYWNDKKIVAREILKSLLVNRVKLVVPKHVSRLFELIAPLVRDEEEKSESQVMDDKFEEEQILVARTLHLISHVDPESQFKLLSYARKTFGQGGLIRIQYTLPALVSAYLELSTLSENDKIFAYVIEILKVLAQHYPRIAYPMYLEAALTADRQKNMKTVSATLSEAFLLYEAEDAKNQPDQLRHLINVLMKFQNLKPESFERLASKLCQYAAKLSRKSEQCRSGLLCSQLFWCDSFKNGEKGIECLSWAAQLVKTCMPIEQIPLLIDVLNGYIYHYEMKNNVKVESINSLLNMIKTNILELEDEDPEKTGTSVRNYYLNTLGYLKLRKANSVDYKDFKL
jgi:vacuolar protein sorting-associated protein 35